MTSNQQTFSSVLAYHYRELFKTPDYAYSAAHCTPEGLAQKMTAGLLQGSANKDGEGIRRTCRDLKIKPTYTAIRLYLQGASHA